MSPYLSNLLGFAAAVVSFVLWLPQALTVWRNRRNPARLAGVSQGTLALILVNAALWGGYALATGAFWAGAPGLVNFPLTLFTLMLVRRCATASDLACACGWVVTEDHDFFVTAPPGYGTVLTPCPGRGGDGFPVPAGQGAAVRRHLAAAAAAEGVA